MINVPEGCRGRGGVGWELPGVRGRGSPRTRWIDRTEEVMTDRGVREGDQALLQPTGGTPI